jgi:DNA polymerase-3 subunit beta
MKVLDDILTWLDNTEPAKPTFQAKSANTNTLTAPEVITISFEVGREVLLSLLDKAISVVPSRDIIPVLNNFQFQASEGELKVIASSTEMSIVTSTTQVETKVPGVQIFPAKMLLNIIKQSYANSQIFIEVTNTGAVIVSGGFSAEIRVSQSKDFPAVDDITDVVFHEIVRSSFLEAISTVRYALPGKDHSGQDSLCMISIKNGKFTACDGARFQQVRIPGFKLSMQLPTFSIGNLIKVLSASDQEILEIGETQNNLVFKINNVIFYMKKLEDPYPNVEQLWLRPALNNDQELLVDKDQLITAIKQVKVTADSVSNSVTLDIEDNQITVSARDNNSNSATAVIACKWDKKPRKLVVNFTHLAELLKAYGPSECRFLLEQDSKTYKAPILLKDNETMALATIAQMA